MIAVFLLLPFSRTSAGQTFDMNILTIRRHNNSFHGDPRRPHDFVRQREKGPRRRQLGSRRRNHIAQGTWCFQQIVYNC
jgi:hypothetical protein